MIIPVALMFQFALMAQPLAPGDELLVLAYEECSLGAPPLRISPNGTILGRVWGTSDGAVIGPIYIAGLTSQQAEKKMLAHFDRVLPGRGPFSVLVLRRAPRLSP